jgi:hypothetical protein
MDSNTGRDIVAKKEFPHMLGIELLFSSLCPGCCILPELLVLVVPVVSKIKKK